MLTRVGGNEAISALSHYRQAEAGRQTRVHATNRRQTMSPKNLIAEWMAYHSIIFGDPREAELMRGLGQLAEADVAAIRVGILSALSGQFRASAFSQAASLCIVLGRIGGADAKSVLTELIGIESPVGEYETIRRSARHALGAMEGRWAL